MTPSLLIVFMNAKGGRDDEFNDWYTNVHIRDVMRLPGSTAVQRFRLGSPSYADKSAHRYLALYEIADRKACIQGHLERLYTPRMPISPAGDFSDLQPAFCDLVHDWNGPVTAVEGPVIAARLKRTGDEEAGLASAWASLCSRLAANHALTAAQLFREGDEQLGEGRVSHPHVALFRVGDLGAAAQASKAIQASWENAIVAGYAPLFPRLTAAEVLDPTPEAQAIEAQARAALGEGARNSRGKVGA